MATTTTTVTLELSDRAAQEVRDALVEEMARTCKIARGYLKDHLAGSTVALSDARTWIGVLNRLADAMDQLDAPGWRETLGKLKAV